MLVVLLFLTASCKKAPEQDETGALLPPEVLEEQTEGVDETQEQAELETGINKSNICKACKDEKFTAGGYNWKYIVKEK